ncbi:type IV pilus modification protein PilV [Piscinibacter sp. XHJ-5]|uniref:type IV pilus modification protein PilV n=1 Tax=Piscinibacter sp. XHJ-5 TaxID=3037797 RepID=UPI00245355C0|nr:type IV pilus modification protein PilV [Piscinibacter sp. XHJ-5]
MLLEVLVSILIFSIGVLSIVGLQANSVKQSSSARYRTDASLLANDLIGRMWVTDRTYATLNTNFATSGTEYTSWLPQVQAALPGSAANPPTVTVVSVPAGGVGGTPSSRVTITLSWKAPNEPAADPVHQLTVVTQIK